MKDIRHGEAQKLWFRTKRCFTVGSDWFVATREGEVGPFKSRNEAELSVTRYLKSSNESQDNSGNANKVARHGIWAANNYI